jgi:diacylglycerol kinase
MRKERTFSGSAGLATRSLVQVARTDRAVRRTVIGMFMLIPVAVLLPVSRIEHLLLVLSLMLVVFAETVNSAIESAVDRISPELHPLSKTAKDTAAAAVVVTVLMAGLSWTVIAGPVAWSYLAGR